MVSRRIRQMFWDLRPCPVAVKAVHDHEVGPDGWASPPASPVVSSMIMSSFGRIGDYASTILLAHHTGWPRVAHRSSDPSQAGGWLASGGGEQQGTEIRSAQ